MCVPHKKSRKKLKDVVQADSPDTKAKEVIAPCQVEPKEEPKPLPPVLLSLVVRRAVDLGDDNYARGVAVGRFVEIEATTQPNTPEAWAQLTWANTVPALQDGGAANKKRLPRDAVVWPAVEISVSLGANDLSVSVAICDVVSVTSDLLTVMSKGKWKAHEEANATTILTAVTNPDLPEVWKHLKWSEGRAGVTRNKRIIDIPTARDAAVTVKLGRDGEKTANLHICKWPKLSIRAIGFSNCYKINRDTAGDFPQQWTAGAVDQPPLCYERNDEIHLQVQLDVDEKPTDDEVVRIDGEAKFGGLTLKWTDNVAVGKAAVSPIKSQPLVSDKKLPNEVDCYDPAKFDWTAHDAKGVAKPLGQTSQIVYAILGPLKKAAYWTFLDLSCRAAKGTKDPDTFVHEVFKGFMNTVGDGKGIKRLRDNVRLTYYLQGRDTPSGDVEPRVWTTEGILELPSGTGRCGGWADVLLHTHAIHGVEVAREVEIYPATPTAGADDVLFLVNTCTFTGPGSNRTGPFPYEAPVDCKKVDGLPGQGKTNPHFVFGDHVLVTHNNFFYDPSYGVRMAKDEAAYETAAIAGLGWANAGVPFKQGTTPQIITKSCSPGWVCVKYDGTRTLNQIATDHGVASGTVLYDDPHNADLKKLRKNNPLQVGDDIYVPRTLAKAGTKILRWKYK